MILERRGRGSWPVHRWRTFSNGGLQKKCGVYDKQTVDHSALPFTIVSGVETLHVLEEIDIPNPFAGALRIITEVTTSLDEVS